MQKVAAYLLERCQGMDTYASRTVEAGRLQQEVRAWLDRKGATESGARGTFKPEDGAAGEYRIVEAKDDEKSWWMVQLIETSSEGQRFITAVSVTAGEAPKVSVYATLESGWIQSRVVPDEPDPKCPRIIRTLLQLPGPWFHGSSTLHRLQTVSGYEEGELLVSELQDRARALPIVVITKQRGEFALPNLAGSLDHDLAALANVFVLDSGAAWALTDLLGLNWACYNGSVRLFWPGFSRGQDRFSHPLWTADRLRSTTRSAGDPTERFRRVIRSLVFRAAALSVVRPREIDKIRDAAARRPFLELRQRAAAVEAEKKIVDAFLEEHDRLEAECQELREQNEELQGQIARLEADRRALQFHLGAKNAAGGLEELDDLAPDSTDGEAKPPTPGEIRFYKKQYSVPSHDILRRAPDCGCNKWESAHAADKAKKGISRLEGGRSDWKLFQHCASCTGGGMWKVRW